MKVFSLRLRSSTHQPERAAAVYVGRPTKWGNPFREGEHGTRTEVIAKFEAYLRDHPTLLADARRELKGRDLLCWCAPLPCHGDVLMKLANEEPQ